VSCIDLFLSSVCRVRTKNKKSPPPPITIALNGEPVLRHCALLRKSPPPSLIDFAESCVRSAVPSVCLSVSN
jgi:hypothetical protein